MSKDVVSVINRNTAVHVFTVLPKNSSTITNLLIIAVFFLIIEKKEYFQVEYLNKIHPFTS